MHKTESYAFSSAHSLLHLSPAREVHSVTIYLSIISKAYAPDFRLPSPRFLRICSRDLSPKISHISQIELSCSPFNPKLKIQKQKKFHTRYEKNRTVATCRIVIGLDCFTSSNAKETLCHIRRSLLQPRKPVRHHQRPRHKRRGVHPLGLLPLGRIEIPQQTEQPGFCHQ